MLQGCMAQEPQHVADFLQRLAEGLRPLADEHLHRLAAGMALNTGVAADSQLVAVNGSGVGHVEPAAGDVQRLHSTSQHEVQSQAPTGIPGVLQPSSQSWQEEEASEVLTPWDIDYLEGQVSSS